MARRIFDDNDIDPRAIIDSVREDNPTPRYPPIEQPKNPSKEAESEEGKETVPVAVPPNNNSAEPPREEPRRKRGKATTDYVSMFLKQDLDMTVRVRKSVYITEEMHGNIQKILRVIGKEKITLAAYVNNVLAHHYEEFQEEIDGLYEQMIREYVLKK